MILFAPSGGNLELLLEQFSVECEVAGMRISTTKFETMVLRLGGKRVGFLLPVGSEDLA